MDKSPDAFRTISEVADHLDTPAHVLRFWESRFPQIRPVKRAGGRRYYRPSDVALLAGIRRLLHEEGLTIRGVQKILREQGVRHVAGLALAEPVVGDVMDAAADSVEAATAPAEISAVEGAGPEVGPIEAAEQPAEEWEDDWGDEGEADAFPAPLADPLAPPAPQPVAVHDDLPLFATPRSDEPVQTSLPAEPPKVALTGLRALRAATPPVAPPPVVEVDPPPVDAQEIDFAPVLARLRALAPGALAPHREAIAALTARLEALRAAQGRPSRGSRG